MTKKNIVKRLQILLFAGVFAAVLSGCEKPQQLIVGGDDGMKEEESKEDAGTESGIAAVVTSLGRIYTIMDDGRIETIDAKLPVNATVDGACVVDGQILINYYEENPKDYNDTNYVVAKCSSDGSVSEIFSKKDIYSRGLQTIGDTAYYFYHYYDLESNSKNVTLKYDAAEGTLVDAPEMAADVAFEEYEGYYNARYDLGSAIEFAVYGYVPMISFDNARINLVGADKKIAYTLPLDEACFLDMAGDDLYYYVVSDPSAVDVSYEVHVRNIKTENDRTLYTAEKGDGSQRNLVPGVEGFKVIDDKAYFIRSDETTDEWYSIGLKDENSVPEKCGLTVKEYDIFDLGHIEKETKAFNIKNSDKVCYSYHIERFVADSSIKNADRINEQLKSISDGRVEAANEEAASTVNMYTADDLMPASYTEIRLGEAKLYGERYLQIIYNGYAYFGGAHGEPFNLIHTFDTETGEEVTIRDIYTGTEEEFNNIALDVMIETVHNPSGYEVLYDEYYEMDDNELRSELAQYINIDTEGFFTDECYVLENSPYTLGSYASGFINTSIPLEKLGIDFK